MQRQQAELMEASESWPSGETTIWLRNFDRKHRTASLCAMNRAGNKNGNHHAPEPPVQDRVAVCLSAAWRLQVRSKLDGHFSWIKVSVPPWYSSVMEPGPATQLSFMEAVKRWQQTEIGPNQSPNLKFNELQSSKCEMLMLLLGSQEIQMRQHEEVDRKLEDKSLVLRFLTLFALIFEEYNDQTLSLHMKCSLPLLRASFWRRCWGRKRETEARLATASNETCKQKRKGWMYEKHENYVKNDQMSWRFVNIFVKNLQKTWILSEIWILHFRILRVSRLKAWSCRNSSSGRCANRRAMLSRWAACFHMPTYKLICQYDIKMLTSLKGEK